MDEIIRVQVMSERDASKGDLEWASIMEECRRELSCVCQKVAQAAGWQLGRPCRPHAPKPSEQRQKAMRTGKGRGICLYEAMRTMKGMLIHPSRWVYSRSTLEECRIGVVPIRLTYMSNPSRLV